MSMDTYDIVEDCISDLKKDIRVLHKRVIILTVVLCTMVVVYFFEKQ
jgi:hypothetical protein